MEGKKQKEEKRGEKMKRKKGEKAGIMEYRGVEGTNTCTNDKKEEN